MPDLRTLLRSLPERPHADELLAGFVPPPRFAGKRFDGYRPDPRHPSQAAAVARLREVAADLHAAARAGWRRRILEALGRPERGGGVYLDGGFGVGKTHLLSALWNAAPGPKAYLSFDELVYTIGLLGVDGTRAAFRGQTLAAVDEWELDDPGNLKLALAFLRGALDDGVRVVTTSNTIPDELGRGRFDQKSFTAEIEELSGAFETLGIQGEDFRQRRFDPAAGAAAFLPPSELDALAAAADERALRVPFAELLAGLGEVHPIRYSALVDRLGLLLVDSVGPMPSLYDALRWVHFIDKVYDAGVPFAATSPAGLGDLFPPEFLKGAYGKKFSRCLSRMAELLAERGSSAPAG
ncbi:MAG: AFG1-family ATPase [Gemmatimonadetes bacterium]|nr:AFG1-family ATPase [Gemmatimonadota bacterium]